MQQQYTTKHHFLQIILPLKAFPARRRAGGIQVTELHYRALRKAERKELELLHQEWFPVEYGKSFYDEVLWASYFF